MAKKKELVVGIDIGTHSVKVCQLQPTGRDGYRLLAAGSAVLPGEAVEDGDLKAPEEVGKIIGALLKNLNIKSKKVGVSISGYSVIVKKINLENMGDEELDKYIRAEAEQYIPFDANDVYLDFQRLPSRKPDPDRQDILLVAAKKEVVNHYLDMLASLKLAPSLVDVDGFALTNIWQTIVGQDIGRFRPDQYLADDSRSGHQRSPDRHRCLQDEYQHHLGGRVRRGQGRRGRQRAADQPDRGRSGC